MTREELTKKIADIEKSIEAIATEANQKIDRLIGAKTAYEDVLKSLDEPPVETENDDGVAGTNTDE